MKKLDYKCKSCGTTQQYRQESILDPKPKELDCTNCDGKATFDFKQLKQSTTIIPENMKAGAEPQMKYNKMSRNIKKFK